MYYIYTYLHNNVCILKQVNLIYVTYVQVYKINFAITF